MSQFSVKFKDTVTLSLTDVPAENQEFIKLIAPGEINIVPVDSRAQLNNYPSLEEDEWSVEFLQLVHPGGGTHLVEIFELLRTGGVVKTSGAVQPVRTAHRVKTKSLVDPTDPFLYVWNDYTAGPTTFKSEIKITVAGAGTLWIATRLLSRQYLRGY